MKVDTTRKWVSIKDLKNYLNEMVRKMKRQGKSPVVMGKRIEEKSGKVVFIPTEIIDADDYKKRKSNKKAKRNKRKKSK